MNLHTFIKKSKDYISCFVKYGAAVIVAPFAKNKENYSHFFLIFSIYLKMTKLYGIILLKA